MPKYYVRKEDGLHEAIRVINGKRVAFRGKTDREVERKMREYTENQERGPLFSEVAEKWSAEHWKRIEPSTAKGYAAPYKYAVAEFGNKRVKKILPSDINAYAIKMKQEGICRNTAGKRMMILSMIFDYSILLGHIQYNPCSAVKLPVGMNHKGRELPSDEVLSVVDRGTWLLPYFLLYSGLRRGEALALTYRDINRKDKFIYVNKSVYYDGSTPKIKPPKSKAGNRRVILLDCLEKIIPIGKDEDLLFPGADGRLMHQSAFYKKWYAWETEVGIKVSPHQLRHGYATLLLEAGLDTKDAQDQLGHSSEAMTKDIYEHIRDRRRKISAEKLNKAAETFAK